MKRICANLMRTLLHMLRLWLPLRTDGRRARRTAVIATTNRDAMASRPRADQQLQLSASIPTQRDSWGTGGGCGGDDGGGGGTAGGGNIAVTLPPQHEMSYPPSPMTWRHGSVRQADAASLNNDRSSVARSREAPAERSESELYEAGAPPGRRARVALEFLAVVFMSARDTASDQDNSDGIWRSGSRRSIPGSASARARLGGCWSGALLLGVREGAVGACGGCDEIR